MMDGMVRLVPGPPTLDGGSPAAGDLPAPKGIGPYLVGALLLGELLVLVGRFTTATLPATGEAWVEWMGRARFVPQLALVAATAVLLFGRGAAGSEPQAPPPAQRSPARMAWLMGVQLVCFGLLFVLSALVFERHAPSASHPGLWLGGWAAAALATAASGALIYRPLSVHLAWLRRNASFVLGIGALSLAAWAVGAWVADDLRMPLRGPTLWMAAALLRPFQDEVVVDPAQFIFGTSNFAVRVAPQCSGFEGIGLTFVFALAYLIVFRRDLRFPQALLLPLIGVLTVWFVNAARLAAFVWIGANGMPGLAEEGFHSIAGTLAFCGVALGTVALSRRFSFFGPRSDGMHPEAAPRTGDATAAYLVPFLAAIALGMVSRAFQPQAALLDPLRTALIAAALCFFWRRYTLGPVRDLGLAAGAAFAAAVLWLWIPVAGGAGTALEFRPPAGGWGWASMAARLAGYVLVVPLAEELAFRGYLMRRLTHADWAVLAPQRVSIPAWLLSSAAFGLLHEHWIAATLAGALFGLVYLRRGSLAAAVIAHGLTNGLLAAHALLWPNA